MGGCGIPRGPSLFGGSREEVREVLPFPGVTKLPGAKPWLLGLANVRGQLLPVTDLSAFFGGPATDMGRMARVLMVNHADIPAGLLVDEVRGFRRFVISERVEAMPEILPGMTQFIAGGYSAGDELWGVLGVHRLVEKFFVSAHAAAENAGSGWALKNIIRKPTF